MDDDVSNGGYFMPREPVEQEIARKKEKASTLESIKVLEDLLKRLDDRVAFYSSVDSIPDEVKTSPEDFMHIVTANALTRNNLKSEREYIESLLDTHTIR